MNNENLDDQVLTFGKYKGHKVSDIADDDPSYVVWLYEQCDNTNNITGKWCSKVMYKACAQEAEDQVEGEYRELDFDHD